MDVVDTEEGIQGVGMRPGVPLAREFLGPPRGKIFVAIWAADGYAVERVFDQPGILP